MNFKDLEFYFSTGLSKDEPPLASPLRKRGHPILGQQCVEEFSQLGCRLELRNRIKLFESTGERVRQAPHRSRSELLILRLKVQTVHLAHKALPSVELALPKCRLEDQL